MMGPHVISANSTAARAWIRVVSNSGTGLSGSGRSSPASSTHMGTSRAPNRSAMQAAIRRVVRADSVRFTGHKIVLRLGADSG
jgi:hypothetical protein